LGSIHNFIFIKKSILEYCERIAFHVLISYLHPMKVKVSSLKHHPKNKEIYTLSSIEELMESISEVGLLQPLIIDSRNQVISGNRRFESLERLGWEANGY